eukprot:CAMPEP_0113533062 /NCGR_PEP_ID=MMETSP0015_2-20120614/4396_1 /TAXON_ID=2838 /ORGANISM="Odontella" /LENGTH=94 /DNA_ID=CAMNT_0000432073 /DNA_START=48 /DNA_END=332 /DNA_ORIENTATION=- /assembly_acc=CAM_ASM_000160
MSSDDKKEVSDGDAMGEAFVAIGAGAKTAANMTGEGIKAAGEGIKHAVTHPKETAKKAVDATILSPYGTNVDGRIDVDKIADDTAEAYEKNQTK